MSNNKEARQYSVLAVMDGFSKTVRWKVSTLLVDGKSNNVFSLRKFAVKQSGGEQVTNQGFSVSSLGEALAVQRLVNGVVNRLGGKAL